MTSRVNQSPLLVLAEEFANPAVNQAAVLVLWGTGSTAQLNQSVLTVLSSFPRRRVIALTD